MSEYQFVDTDTNELLASFVSKYETLAKRTLGPADPERLFISWAASIFVQERGRLNFVGNQNIPSRAVGENLDALGEAIVGLPRRGVTAAKTTIRFNISAAQASAQLIPAGTRVSDMGNNVVFATDADAYIPAGSLSVDALASCVTTKTVDGEEVNIGAAGNGYVAGQLSVLIDVYDYYASCANITESTGGADIQTDAEYYQSMREYMDAWSVAGPMGAYIYWAKSVSGDIADVKVVMPQELVSETLPVYQKTGSSDGYAFAAGDIVAGSLSVYPHGSSTPAEIDTDYTIDYTGSLLTITCLSSGTLNAETEIDVEYSAVQAGRVNIYTLMKDGSVASSTIKALILEACSDDSVRPLTDFVSVEDPEYALYQIEFTYYVPADSDMSMADIESNVAAAVDEYVAWQSGRIGRDISPDYLHYLLMQAGIKRVSIIEPAYTYLPDGSSGGVPFVAQNQSVSITNGGYEDE